MWVHQETRWEVHHCGHKTALYPYYAVDPAAPHTCIVGHHGRGFSNLIYAIRAAEALLHGASKLGPVHFARNMPSRPIVFPTLDAWIRLHNEPTR